MSAIVKTKIDKSMLSPKNRSKDRLLASTDGKKTPVTPVLSPDHFNRTVNVRMSE